MRIAISANGNNGLDSPISHHFGRCPYFILVDLEGEQVQQVQVIDNPFFQHHQPGMVPGFINEQDVDIMLAGGMGWRAIEFFEGFGIQVGTGAHGTVNDTLSSYLKGELQGAAPCKDQDHDHGDHDCDH